VLKNLATRLDIERNNLAELEDRITKTSEISIKEKGKVGDYVKAKKQVSARQAHL